MLITLFSFIITGFVINEFYKVDSILKFCFVKCGFILFSGVVKGRFSDILNFAT